MSELTDRLRTCVAHLATIEISEVLVDSQMEAIIDARKLLLEAADTLEAAGVGTVVMDTQAALELDVIPEQILPPPDNFSINRGPSPFWYDDALRHQSEMMHQPSRNACPNCDSRANKTVRKGQSGIILECPVCGSTWKKR